MGPFHVVASNLHRSTGACPIAVEARVRATSTTNTLNQRVLIREVMLISFRGGFWRC
jgi:hypothetical protein